eukprot:TCALIF_13824-PA protein Name:"Similar to APX1 Putative ascorbate peroxidase (Hydra viridissima)" AED:0.25 eAED:0.27 QI:0/0.33/0.5/1/1/1/4/131/220
MLTNDAPLMPRIPFRFGRKDCATSPISAESRTFPKGRDDFDAVMAFFAIEFGLGPRLGTALSGAHTLGGAAGAAGSGFLGFWKENATEAAKFDARYFSLMADPDLNWNLVNAALQTNANSPRWQWEGFRDNEQAWVGAPAILTLVSNPRQQFWSKSMADSPTSGYETSLWHSQEWLKTRRRHSWSQPAMIWVVNYPNQDRKKTEKENKHPIFKSWSLWFC